MPGEKSPIMEKTPPPGRDSLRIRREAFKKMRMAPPSPLNKSYIFGTYFSKKDLEYRELILKMLLKNKETNMTELLNAADKMYGGSWLRKYQIQTLLWKMIAVEFMRGDRKFIDFYMPRFTGKSSNALEIRFFIRDRKEAKQAIKHLE